MRQPLHVVLPWAVMAVAARAEPPIFVTKLLYRVPRTDTEVAEAHEQSRFAALQQNALRDVRGLGLFVKRGERLSAERLRTLVIVNRGQLLLEDTTTGAIDLGASLELMFVRARPRVAADNTQSAADAAAATGGNAGALGNGGPATRDVVDSSDLELHAFATSGDRRRLHYLKPFAIPEKLDECGIQSTVRITEYLLAGQYPSARDARRIHYCAIASLSMDRLDQYATAASWSGDALDNLTEILDAVIDKK